MDMSDFTEERIEAAMILHEKRRRKKHDKSIFGNVPSVRYSPDELRILALADLYELQEKNLEAKVKEQATTIDKFRNKMDSAQVALQIVLTELEAHEIHAPARILYARAIIDLLKDEA